ncbi:cupin domain-containing protein [Mycobacterium sp. 134]|uniref:cupin domain-containing protein n=1 Tax=Mycobacterium sp. 134 TaxID=3400425 RepID=UPI003AACF13E
MSTPLPAQSVDTAALALDHAPLPAESVVAGAPTTGFRDLIALSDMTIGVWEHTPGVSRDVEADEVFVVLSGDASVAFDDGSPPIDLRPAAWSGCTRGSTPPGRSARRCEKCLSHSVPARWEAATPHNGSKALT